MAASGRHAIAILLVFIPIHTILNAKNRRNANKKDERRKMAPQIMKIDRKAAKESDAQGKKTYRNEMERIKKYLDTPYPSFWTEP
jgi:uncharacterized membrane protein